MTSTPPPAPKESWDEHYKVPILRHVGTNSIQFGEHPTAIHEVALSPGRSIDFYAKLTPAPDLFVSLHGAVPIASPRYPHFRRVESMRNRVDALLCIADPTLRVSSSDDFRLAWYVGSEGWDPTEELAEVVRQAMRHVGASRVMFLGGSGGGFASLHLATLFPGSMAFVQDPQVEVAKYYQPHRERLFAAAWPSWEQDEAFKELPHRFNMTHHYVTMNPENYIYYRQSASDEMHLKNHAQPFERAVSELSGAQSGHFRFIYEEGEKPGHGKITPSEFDRHFDAAMQFWQ